MSLTQVFEVTCKTIIRRGDGSVKYIVVNGKKWDISDCPVKLYDKEQSNG